MSDSYEQRQAKCLSIESKNNQGWFNSNHPDRIEQDPALVWGRNDRCYGQPNADNRNIQKSWQGSQEVNSPTNFLQTVGIIDCYFSDSPFTPERNRRREYKQGDKVRSVTLKELCLEIDLQEDNISNRLIAKKIQLENFDIAKEKGLVTYLFDHKGKSSYLRFYFSGSFTSKFQQREYFKEFVAKYFQVLPVGFKYDLSFYDKFHWCPLEKAEHWKYPGNIHALIDSANTGKLNVIDESLIVKKQPVLTTSSVSIVPTKCPFLDYALENKLPQGDRNKHLYPNAVALFNADQLIKFEQVQEDRIGWKNGKPTFNCKQLQSYADSVRKRTICDLCLLGVGADE